MKVAIVGAPQTGKTTLTQALSSRLCAQGLPLELVEAASLDSMAHIDLVLLCGLDLHHPTPRQNDIDQKIRLALQQAKLSFQVVYGSGEQRLANALFCIGRQAPQWAKQLERPEPAKRWRGPCETCGDGDCEHRLFTGLIKP